MNRHRQALCKLDALPEGASRGFRITTSAGDDDIFLVHKDGRITGYRNSCPHTGGPLDWVPDQFLNLDGDLIQCATHDALFRIDNGLCVVGPCAGKRLSRIEIAIENNVVYADLSGRE